MVYLAMLILILTADHNTATKTVSCDQIVGHDYPGCTFNNATVIDGEDYEILSNKHSVVIGFVPSWKIRFLPVKVGKVFPHLKLYYASSLLISTLSHANFEGLKDLEEIHLGYNQIEEIKVGVFTDVKSLKVLAIREYSI